MIGTCSFVCCNRLCCGYSSCITTARFAGRCLGCPNCCHRRGSTIGFGETTNRFTWKWTRRSWRFERLFIVRIWVQCQRLNANKHFNSVGISGATLKLFLHRYRYYHHYYPYRPYYGYPYGYPYGYYGKRAHLLGMCICINDRIV